MPIYKSISSRTGKISWYVSLYYQDWTGKTVRKCKRGFKRERDAKEWERKFRNCLDNSPFMTFESLIKIYMEDISPRLKPSTIRNKQKIIDKYLLPSLGHFQLDSITPAIIRKWQLNILNHEANLTPTYQRTIHSNLSTIFNYAVKFYGLTRNPALLAGAIGKHDPHVAFWTPEQFQKFLKTNLNNYYTTLFSLLFWSGMRIGEALALFSSDFDFTNHTVSITKDYYRAKGGKEYIQAPKTPNSIRTITLPKFIINMVQQWILDEDIDNQSRIFEGVHLTGIEKYFRVHTSYAGLPHLRVHDLRHSHASLLAHLNVPAIIARDRLGHKDIKTTLNIYSHVYPEKHTEVASILDNLHKNLT